MLEKAKSDSIFSTQIQRDVESFEKSVETAELPLFQLTKIATQPQGIFVIILFNLLLVVVLILTTSLVHSKNNYYSKEVATVYRNIIIDEYKKNMNECDKILRERFNYESSVKPIYDDPPFNSIKTSSSIPTFKFDGLSITLKEFLL